MDSSPTKNPYLENDVKDVIQINTNPYLMEEEVKKEESPSPKPDEEDYKSLDSNENSANQQLHSTSQEVIDVGNEEDELAELDSGMRPSDNEQV